MIIKAVVFRTLCCVVAIFRWLLIVVVVVVVAGQSVQHLDANAGVC